MLHQRVITSRRRIPQLLLGVGFMLQMKIVNDVEDGLSPVLGYRSTRMRGP